MSYPGRNSRRNRYRVLSRPQSPNSVNWNTFEDWPNSEDQVVPRDNRFDVYLPEEAQIQLATEASLNMTINKPMKDTVTNIMKYLMRSQTVLPQMKAEFANLKREGFSADSVVVKTAVHTDPEADPVFDKIVEDYFCIVCREMPYNPQYCCQCRFYYCYRCLELENSNSVGCSAKPESGRASPPKIPHKIIPMETSARKLLSSLVSIKCEYGELENKNGVYEIKIMDFFTAQSHYIEGRCPKAICNDCGLLRFNMSIRHDRPEDCLSEMNEFCWFLIAKKRLTVNEKDKEIRRLNTTIRRMEMELKSTKQNMEELRTKYNRLSDRDLAISHANSRKLADLEKLLSQKPTSVDGETKISTVGQPEVIDLTKESADLILFANPTNPQKKQDETTDPVIFISFGTEEKRRLYNISRDDTFATLLEKSCKIWKIPPEDRKYFTIFDIRCRLRNEDIKMGTMLRNCHTFNLVPNHLFKDYLAYEFHLKEKQIISSYNTEKMLETVSGAEHSGAEETDFGKRMKSVVNIPPKKRSERVETVVNRDSHRNYRRQQHQNRDQYQRQSQNRRQYRFQRENEHQSGRYYWNRNQNQRQYQQQYENRSNPENQFQNENLSENQSQKEQEQIEKEGENRNENQRMNANDNQKNENQEKSEMEENEGENRNQSRNGGEDNSAVENPTTGTIRVDRHGNTYKTKY